MVDEIDSVRAFLASMSDAVILLDRDGGVRYVNPSFSLMLGYSQDYLSSSEVINSFGTSGVFHIFRDARNGTSLCGELSISSYLQQLDSNADRRSTSSSGTGENASSSHSLSVSHVLLERELWLFTKQKKR